MTQRPPSRMPKGCVEDMDRHGNVRVYYRGPDGRKIRLRNRPGSPEFYREHLAAIEG